MNRIQVSHWLDRSSIAWTLATVLAITLVVVLREYFGPRAAWLALLLVLVGGGFIALATQARRRWGGPGLAAASAVAAVSCALLLAGLFDDWLRLRAYTDGLTVALSSFSLSFAAAALAVHLLARRPRIHLLDRDLPWTLAVYVVGQLIGIAIGIVYLFLTTPFIV